MKVKNKLKPLTIEFCKRFLVCKMGSAKGHLMFAKKRNGESFTALDYWDKLHLMANQDLVTMLLGSGKKVDIMEQASLYTPETVAQMEAVRKKYEGTDKWMKAPNGEPTKLTEEQWLLVRTPNFKGWFGDWENKEIQIDVKNVSNDEAKGILLKTKDKVFVNEATLIKAQVSRSGRKKMLDPSSFRLSMENGFTWQEHISAACNIGELYEKASLSEITGDKYGQSKSKKYFSVYCSFNKKPAIAVMTILETVNAGHRIYSVQLVGLEKPAGILPRTVKKRSSASADLTYISIADVANKVNTCSKVLDENGEPLVVYHGTDAKNISEFKASESGALGAGMYFWDKEDLAKGHVKNIDGIVYGCFLNIKNPYIAQGPNPGGVEIMEKLQKNGHDGVVHPMGMYVAFDPNQIKSATGNNGNFSLDSNNIFEQAAFHGSGVGSIQEFDLGYLGTGEGAQAHGWGLYFAKDRKVAEGYRNKILDELGLDIWKFEIKDDDFEEALGIKQNYVGADRWIKEDARDFLKDKIDFLLEHERELNWDELEREARGYITQKAENGDYDISDIGGNLSDYIDDGVKRVTEWFKEKSGGFKLVFNGGLYEVEIPDDDVLLDEQKTLDKQPAKVKKALRQIEKEIGVKWHRQLTIGKDIYTNISNVLGSQRAASELLNKYGIKGITYEGNQDGRCFVVFDDKAVEIINVFNQENGKATQAQSAFLGNNVANVERFVDLLKDADITTFFHEAGHIFFVDLMMLGQNPLATEQMKRDWETVLKWTEWDENQLKEYENTAAYGQMAEIDREIREAMGTPQSQQVATAPLTGGQGAEGNGTPQPQPFAPITGGKRLEAALNRWRQERWARAVEDYCIKGDVPSEGLRKALSNIKKWLVKVYRMLRGAGVPMSKEVKDVMDRMLASKEAVELAAAKAGLEDFRRQGGLDMASDSAKDMWLKLYDEAKERAEAKVRALAMGDLEEERQVQMEEARARERERATKMFQNTRHFRAKAYLDATPNIDRNLVLAKFSLTPEEYERDVANDGGSVENAVAKYMKDVYEPVLQKEFYVTQAQMQKKAEEALQEPKYRAVVTAFEGEILESYNKRFHRLSAKLEKEEGERVRQKREAQAAVVKQNIQNLLDTLTPARVRGMAEDANIPEDLDKIPKEGLLDRVKNWLKNIIGKNITDPLGNKVHFALKEGETEEDYALHLLAGKDNAGVEDVERRRAIGVMLAERTIKRPWAVVTQENGRKLYMSIYKGRSGNIAEQVVVAVEDGEDGVVITSFPTMDRGLKNTALKEFKRRVSNAKAVDYLGTPAMGYSREARNKQTSNGSTPYSAVAKNSIADLDIDVNNLTPQEKRARREELHKETIRQLKEELKSAKQATRQAALEVVRNCRKYAARRMEDLPVSESGDFCKKNFSKSS
ncbi:MAG: hypothetical protein Q4E42_05950 [Phascolarctobacterium sp.]|nr:hypothetical protein [Phascolarctobacterium sp.]